MTPKPNRRSQARSLILLVFAASAFFAFIVLPQLDRARALKQKAAPDFVLPVIYGGTPGSRQKLADLRGKAVILDFWASWCAPCRAQIPALNRVAQKFEREVVVLGVNTGDERAKAIGLLRTLNVSYVSVEDEGGHIAQSYGVTILPTLVMINRQGQVKYVGSRVLNEKELQAELAGLL